MALKIPPGRVAGVRTWRLANTMWAQMGGWLWSLAMTDCWRPGVEWKEAECRIGHRIPDEGCMCGIWAYYDMGLMEEAFGPLLSASPKASSALKPAIGLLGGDNPYEHVTGIIASDGDIVVHELGFRAQFAKVAAIFEDDFDTPKRAIAEQYRFPIIAPGEYDTFCAEHGLRRLDHE